MISFYRPAYEDMWFRQMMLSDEATMSYNHSWGGTIPFPEEDWGKWFDYWIADTEGKRFYRYIKDECDNIIGETAYHYDEDLGIYLADVIILAKFRRKGYGGQALDMLCSKARENGIKMLYDDIAADNPAIGMFLKHGFSEVSRNEKTIMLAKEL
ncbi:MAG: GNAT family N-acetyltransferase [Spirochaetales bacterium]|nr:GNAT family N-acetyltransferase [Spirochaetales bacterium]